MAAFKFKGSIQYYDVKFQADGVKQMIRVESVRELTEEDEAILSKFRLEQEQAKLLQEQKLASESIAVEASGDEARRADAELLLAIQNPHVKNEAEKTKESVDGLVVTSDAANQRKSLRVKKLKTFKDEIVYYPPSSSKSYNIESNSKVCAEENAPSKMNFSKEEETIEGTAVNSEIVVDIIDSKKPKINEGVKQTVVARQKQSAERLRKKLEDTKKARIQSYLQKSVKLAKSKKQAIESANKMVNQSVFIVNLFNH